MSTGNTEREAAEAAYADPAYNLPKGPVGSRDWTLYYGGWMHRAALSAPPAVPPVDDFKTRLMATGRVANFKPDGRPGTPVAAVAQPTLKDRAEALMQAGHDFWQACRREAGGGAVRWLKATDGTTIIFTRGEYSQALLRSIGNDYQAPETVFEQPVGNDEMGGIVAKQAEPAAVAQPVADERAKLLAYVLQDEEQNRLTPRVIDIAYTAFMLAKQPAAENGDSSDWFNDTKPVVEKAIEKLRNDFAALAASPSCEQSAVPAAALTQDDRNAIDHGIEAIEHMHRNGDWGDCCPQYVASLRKIANLIAATPSPEALPAMQEGEYPPLPAAQYQFLGKGHSDDAMRAYVDADRASRAQAAPAAASEPQWIVNDLGELGVHIDGRFFFLYKGENLEYGAISKDGVALHDDETPMQYRMVGKREFGEVQYPDKWLREGSSKPRYTEELVFTPGLSFGKPEDGAWRPLPAAPQNTKLQGDAA